MRQCRPLILFNHSSLLGGSFPPGKRQANSQYDQDTSCQPGDEFCCWRATFQPASQETRQQGLALANHFHHWALAYRVLVRDAGIIQQASRVDRHLLGVGAQPLLPERLIGKSARRVPHENRVGKVHITSINVLLSSVIARIPVLAL